jgi:hypothetical protein
MQKKEDMHRSATLTNEGHCGSEDDNGREWLWWLCQRREVAIEKGVSATVRAHRAIVQGTEEFWDEANRHDLGEYLYCSNYHQRFSTRTDGDNLTTYQQRC